jgi:hypothetical protein
VIAASVQQLHGLACRVLAPPSPKLLSELDKHLKPAIVRAAAVSKLRLEASESVLLVSLSRTRRHPMHTLHGSGGGQHALAAKVQESRWGALAPQLRHGLVHVDWNFEHLYDDHHLHFAAPERRLGQILAIGAHVTVSVQDLLTRVGELACALPRAAQRVVTRLPQQLRFSLLLFCA